MKVNVVTKNGMSALSVKTDFNEVLDKNLAAICDAIASKGIILKELLKLFEECDDEFLEVVLLTPVGRKGKKEAEQSLSEELEISLARHRPIPIEHIIRESHFIKCKETEKDA